MEYKKPQPLLTLSFFLIIGAVAIGYYLDAPLYKEMQTQQTQINNLSSTNNLRIQYENKIREIDQKLKENNWEAKKEIIKGSFESSPFIFQKLKYSLKILFLKNGLSFGNVSISCTIFS
jgi:cell division septal protein FtsQ